MLIVSLNAWGGVMYDALAKWLVDCGADVLCLQEVTRTPGAGEWVTYADGERSLPQRANLFDDVRAMLPHHQAWFIANDSGPVVDDDGRSYRQEFGLAMFVGERYPVIGMQSSFVHRGFVDHDEWPADDRPRAAQGVRLVDRARGRTVTVAHMHGVRDRNGKGDTPQRRRQAERLAALVTSLRGPDDLAVVCGDFNVLPDSETLDVLSGAGLVDLVGGADTRTSSYVKKVRHASYLLVSDPSAVTRFEIVGAPEVSDHRPLTLEI